MEQQKLVLSKKEGEDIHQEKLPELRFTDYDKLLVSNLGDLAKIGTGDKNLQDKVDDGIYPFFVRSENIERINSYSFDGEAVLIPGDGVNVGKIYHYINGKFDFHQRVYKISDFDKKILGKYVYYYMRKNFIREVHKNSQKASVDSLRLPTIKQMKIKFPSDIKEQQKIVNILEKVDEKIGLLEKNLNAFQKYYEYVSNNYFDNIACENIVKFKDIIIKGKAGGTPKSSNKSYYDGEIPFLSINDMTTQGKYINYTTKMITEEGLNNSNAWIIPKNSLLYSIYASIGFVSINKIELTTSQAIYGVILKENINQDFIYHYLKNFKRHIYKYIETGTQGNLNSKIVNDIPIKLPSNNEQKFYADFFNKFDESIEIKLNEIDKFKEFKRGLLQKMFV